MTKESKRLLDLNTSGILPGHLAQQYPTITTYRPTCKHSSYCWGRCYHSIGTLVGERVCRHQYLPRHSMRSTSPVLPPPPPPSLFPLPPPLTNISTPAGTTMGLKDREWGHMGVMIIQGTLGWTMLAPAARE